MSEPEGSAPQPKSDRELNHKDLRDEIQLYWLIQLGTITALGALMGTWPKNDSSDPLLVKLTVLLVGFVLVTIAGMYNVVGNYYTFAANYRLGRSKQQESVVTPWLARAQSLIAAFLGAAVLAAICEGIESIIYGGTKNPAPSDPLWPVCLAYLIGALLGFVIYGWSIATVFKSFRQRSTDGSLEPGSDVLDMVQAFIAYSRDLQQTRVVWFGQLASHLASRFAAYSRDKWTLFRGRLTKR